MLGLLSKKTKANVALFSAGIFFGFSSPLARIMGTWLNPFSVVFTRFLFALPFSFIFLKENKLKNIPFKKVLPFSVFLPTSVCLYTFAIFNTKVSLAIFSYYIANIISSIIIGYLFNKERLSKNKIVGFILAIGAMFTFINSFQDLSINTGMLFGYASGIIATLTSLYQKNLSKTIEDKVLTFAQIVGGLIVSGLAIFFIKDVSIFTLSWEGVLFSLIFGFLFFFINYLMIYGFKNAEIGIGTILLSSELIFGPIAAYFIFNERLSELEMFGGVLIILSTFFVSRHKSE